MPWAIKLIFSIALLDGELQTCVRHGEVTTLNVFGSRIINPQSSYVYYTQVMQAETLASAYRLWRRNWAGKGKEYTAGALVWQVRRHKAVKVYDEL